jgi:hypothetical protein
MDYHAEHKRVERLLTSRYSHYYDQGYGSGYRGGKIYGFVLGICFAFISMGAAALIALLLGG